MANSLQINTSNEVAGLGTFAYTITSANAGQTTIDVKSTIPLGSGLLITIKNNASTIVANGGADTDPTPTQQSIGSRTTFETAAGDVVSVVLSSSNAVDSLPNAVKSNINLYQGF